MDFYDQYSDKNEEKRREKVTPNFLYHVPSWCRKVRFLGYSPRSSASELQLKVNCRLQEATDTVSVSVSADISVSADTQCVWVTINRLLLVNINYF